MKQMFLATAFFLLGAASQAASYGYSSYSGSNSLTGLLGFNSSAVTFGVNFENHSSGNIGLGGYFLYSAEKKEVGIPQVTSFGGIAPVHFLDDARVNLYLAPGFGVHMIKGFGAGSEDVTTFGPLWKVGSLFKITSNVKAGIEHTQLVNWFSDKKAAQFDYTNAALSFAF